MDLIRNIFQLTESVAQDRKTFISRDPNVSLTVKHHRENSMRANSVSLPEVNPSLPFKTQEFTAAGQPHGAIRSTDHLVKGTGWHTLVMAVRDHTSIRLQVDDRCTAHRDPEAAIEIRRERANVERGSTGAQRIQEESKTVESVQPQRGADPKISVLGLRKRLYATWRTIPSSP
jgi:hypothetical protein